MADKTIVIPDLSASSVFKMNIARRDAAITIEVTYVPAAGPPQEATIEPAEVPAAARDALRDLFAALLPICRAKMGF